MLDGRTHRDRKLLATLLLGAAMSARSATGTVISERQLGLPTNGVAAGPNGAVYVIHDKQVSYFETYDAGSWTVNGAVGLGKAVSTLAYLWIGDSAGNQIFRVSHLDGQTTAIPIPTPSAGLGGLCVGPDGNLWFTEISGNKIGRVAPDATVTEFPIPTANSAPFAITAGPDGALWFVEYSGNKLARITTAGAITEHAIPTAGAHPTGIAALEARIAFTESTPGKIGMYYVAGGGWWEYPVPTAGATPWDIVGGPDQNFYFTERDGNAIGRIFMIGSTITELPVPTAASDPLLITAAPDGSLWFTEHAALKLGRIQLSYPGDVNADGKVNVNDVFYLINFLFSGGPPPM